MWTCPYCGHHHGMFFEDRQLTGVICLHPDCGRIDEIDREELKNSPELYTDSDM
jgi:hypothetical protein